MDLTFGGLLTPDSAFLGTSLPLMPLIMSKSNPVKEAVNFIASSLSLRAGTLSTKTFPNYDAVALSVTESKSQAVESPTYSQGAVVQIFKTLLGKRSFAVAQDWALVYDIRFG